MALASLGGWGGGTRDMTWEPCPFSTPSLVDSHFPVHSLAIGPERRAPGSSGISLMDSLFLFPICLLPLLEKQVCLSQSWKQSAWRPASIKGVGVGVRVCVCGGACSFPPRRALLTLPYLKLKKPHLVFLLFKSFQKNVPGLFCQAAHGFLWVLNHSLVPATTGPPSSW